MTTKTLIHPTTGDCVTVLVDAADSSGALFRFEYDARTPTPPAEDHAHPEEESIEVVAGTLYCRVDGRERRLVAGESIVFPPWSVHAVWHGEPGGVALDRRVPARRSDGRPVRGRLRRRGGGDARDSLDSRRGDGRRAPTVRRPSPWTSPLAVPSVRRRVFSMPPTPAD